MRLNALLRLVLRPCTCCLLIMLALLAPMASANQAALAWLVTQSQADGSYSRADDIATSTQATSETLRTLHAFNPAVKASPATLAYLDASAGLDVTEYLARAVVAHTEAGGTAAGTVSQLEALQNPDGGFGGAHRFTSNALDTAYALEALAKASGSHDAVISAAVAYLSAHQNADGSYTLDSKAQGPTYTTSAVVMALHAVKLRFDPAQPLISNALRYLLSTQDSTGGWGSDFQTAWVVLALAPEMTDTAPISAAVQVLENTQLTDGSWGQDVYTTALAARALLKKPGTQPSGDGIVTGHVVIQGSGLPLSGVMVSGGGQSARTAADGSFRLQGVAPGTQSFNFSLDGFDTVSRTEPVTAGQSLDLGKTALSALPDKGIVLGNVTDAANGQPLAGVSVVFSGSSTVSTTTDALGAYRIVAPPGAFAITASAPGYLDVSATATLSVGTLLTFSPGLQVDTASPPSTADLYGTVQDADTGKALANVSVTLAGSSSGVVTDTDGKFALPGLTPGTFTLDLALAGYQTVHLSLTAPAGRSDLGEISLQAVTANGNTLAGVVTDSATGAAVPDAVVSIASEGKTARTAADGSYQIGQITQSKFTVSVGAAGFVSRQGEVSLSQPGLATFNMALDRAVGNNIDISPISLGQSSYPANSHIKVPVHLVNSDLTERKVRLYAEIVDAKGQVAGQFPARSVPLGGDPAGALTTVPAQGAADDEISWHNGGIAPGHYEFIVQANDGDTGQLLAERSTAIEIQATRAIGGPAEFDPPIAQLAAQKPVKINAKLSNRGNVDLAGGTVTAKVTLKNAGYASTNPVMEFQPKTLVQGNGLVYPLGIDRDNAGNIYVANYTGRNLLKVAPDGTVTEVYKNPGYYSFPIDVDVAPDGDIYDLNAYYTYEHISADGSRQTVPTGLTYNQAIEALPNGNILVAGSTSNNGVNEYGVYELAPDGGKTKLPLVGLSSNVTEIQTDAQGVVYIGDTSNYLNGKIYRVGANNTLETVQQNLPNLGTFAIAPDGTVAVIYSNQLALISPGGVLSKVPVILPNAVKGMAWDSDGQR